MRKLIVSDTIRASRDIYIEHITDIEQVDTRSRMRFKKRTIYPSDIISEWYEDGSEFPTRASIPPFGFTIEVPVSDEENINSADELAAEMENTETATNSRQTQV